MQSSTNEFQLTFPQQEDRQSMIYLLAARIRHCLQNPSLARNTTILGDSAVSNFN